MEYYSTTISLNGKQLPATINTYAHGDKTVYDVTYDDISVNIYKNSLYTWTSDDSKGLSQADIQNIGEQIQQ